MFPELAAGSILASLLIAQAPGDYRRKFRVAQDDTAVGAGYSAGAWLEFNPD